MKAEDRRFIQYWLDQKKGPRWKYYLTFIVAWTVVSFILIFFLAKLFTNLWETGGPALIYIFIGIGFVAGIVITHLTYTCNEKKLKKLHHEYQEEFN